MLEEASKSGNMALHEQARLSHEGCQVISFGPKKGGLQLASACSKGHVRWLMPDYWQYQPLYVWHTKLDCVGDLLWVYGEATESRMPFGR